MNMHILEGRLDARGLRIALVVGKFNEFVTDRLLAGALDVLHKAGAADEALTVVKVPGAFEIPLTARRLARSGRFHAVVCLGAVIRGETPHFEYISAVASRGIAQAGWETDVPVVFGVLTTDTADQAIARAGGPEQNRGADAARTAIEMATLLASLPGEGGRRQGRTVRALRPRRPRRR